ncbi:MAG: ATP-binding protein [Candidatus Aminicenantes bacterium]|nr:ATP-binding protein [Candidatus Aminicenantes bacterium]
MKFYDRKKEVAILKKAGRVAVLGRRRIGKTRLLQESVTGPFIYLFFFSEASEAFIAGKWTEAVKSKDIYIPKLDRISDILEYVFRNTDLPIVIDELQNARKKFPEIISLLQHLMDEHKQKQVYVTGSLISMMKKVVEDYRSPIFGRFDFTLKLKELDVETVMEIMSDLGYPAAEALKYYAVFGGIPKYYELIETLKPADFNEFINLMFFKYPRPLYNEIYVMLKEEIGKEFHNYFGVLHAISQNGVTFGAIASALNMVSTSVSKYLNSLIMDYELVGREQPISKKKKKTHYFINSNIIDFWFTYCFSSRDDLDRGDEEVVYQGFLNNFPTFYGSKFEKIIVSLLPRVLRRKKVEYSTIGRDWGKRYEFDFVVDSNDLVYIGEIKKGELNVSAEIKKIEAVVQQESFYKNRQVRYMMVGDRFINKKKGRNIHYIDTASFFA